jgi:hypothetical protein|tara:strand:- start:185 stop:415 length:231 start_codon:yes stop_codon:yes gene_type:complete
MATSGRKTIKIDAPVMLLDGTPVWMDRNWVVDFFDWLGKTKLKVSGMKHMEQKLQLTFVTAKECTMFGLKYASRKK